VPDLPTGIQFATATFWGNSAVGDTLDDLDRDPDMVPMRGVVSFVPNMERSTVPGAAPQPTTIFPKIIVCDLDSQGFLVDRTGSRDVRLVATGQTGVMSPPIQSYTVLFELVGVAKFSKVVLLPANETVDLSLAIEVPAEPGQEQAAWDLAVTQTLAARDAALSAAQTAQAALAGLAKGEANGVAGLDSAAHVPEVQLPSRLSSSSLDGTYVTRRVHIIDASGQSLMSGRGLPYSNFLDPTHPRILQFPTRGSSMGKLVTATEPLVMRDIASGIGHAYQFARNWIEDLPEDDIIVIVPNAYGGTALCTNATPLGWRHGVAGNLEEQSLAWTLQAAEAARIAYPNAIVTIDVALWAQGETDGNAGSGVTRALYQADLDPVIQAKRDAYGEPNLPFVIFQMIPEAINNATRHSVDDAHRNTPYRVHHTGFSLSEPGYAMPDNLHSTAPAYRKFYGPRGYAEFKRIRSGRAPINADVTNNSELGPVVGLAPAAATTAHSVQLSWTALTGVTGYRVEYQEPTTATWINAGTTTGTTFLLGALSGAKSYNVRVVPYDTAGDGVPSATAVATTLAETVVVSDTATRADGAIGSANTGQAWSIITSTFLVGSNRLYHGSTVNALAEIESGIADGIARMTLEVLPTAGTGARPVIVRGDGTASNYWAVQVRTGTLAYEFYEWAGAATYAPILNPKTASAGDVIEVSMTGSQVALRVNGVLVTRVAAASFLTATKHGFGGSGSNVPRYDNFVVSH
jgi:hypothetical protein